MPPIRLPIPVVVAEGCVEEGPTWDLIQDLRFRAQDSRCPHLEALPTGQEVLPHALTAYTAAGFRSTTLCYDCVRAAVHQHFPAWDTRQEEKNDA